MTSSLLNIGKSGLLAAQVGLSTTGHNIANANVAGFTRQTVLQSASASQSSGFGYTGAGTEVTQIKRVYDTFLASQVRTAQSTSASLETFSRQISQLDNLLADPAAGLSPALQDFFKSVQDVSANPASTASRQALLSGAGSLASRFQMLSARMAEVGDGVNSEIVSNVEVINSYSRQIAQLNGAIANLDSSVNNQPNDMLDQRDQLLNELNKYVKTTVVQDADNRLTVSIGSGQPLVVGVQAFQLAATGSPTDPSRMQVGYQVGSKVTVLPENSLNGGSLGGLLEFRSSTLDRAQNSLGHVALSLALSFNAQHKLGQDLTGRMGGDFFTVEPASVSANSRNNPTSTTVVSAVASDPSALTASDYSMKFTNGFFYVKRLPDGTPVQITGSPQTVDGVAYTVSGTAAEGDSFLVRPTVFGAANFTVAVTDRSSIAAGTPVRAGVPGSANIGDAKISAVSVDASYLPPPGPGTVTLPLPLTFDAVTGTLQGFPGGAVRVSVNGVDNGAVTSVAYKPGDVIAFGGISVTFSGQPGQGDTFTVEANLGGVGDNRNAALLAKLQTANILDGGHATYQGSYAETVSFVGNKTREVQIQGQASAALVTQAEAQQQSISGVNLDEEAANLLRYQQAYQAAGKVMQMASNLFDVLLTLGR